MKFPLFNWWRTGSPKPRRTRRIETAVAELESRVLLSGNVAAVVADGSLTLNGDRADNQVEVVLSDGHVVVRGLNGTTINGSGSFVAFRNTNRIPEDLVVRLRQGDDTLIVSDGVRIGDDLKVTDRSGATTVGLNGAAIGDDVRIRTGKRNDRISVTGTHVGDDVRIRTGRGDDLVAFLESTANDSIKARTGRGDDDVVLQKVTVRDKLRVATGRGDDDAVVEDSRADRMVVKTRRGDDFLYVSGTGVAESTRVKMSPGDDLFVQEQSDLPHSRRGRRPAPQPVRPADVDPAILEQHLSDPQTGAVTRAEALREMLDALTGDSQTPDPEPPDPPTVTFDLSANAQTTESNGTLLTTLETITISGETTPFAEIEVGQPGGTFPAATATADANGQYVVDLTLNPGQQTVVIRATDAFDQSGETEFDIHRAVGTVVRFSLSWGTFDVELFDDDAPNTVANFLNYQQRYQDSIIHRAPTDFVIQGGGFVFDNGNLTPIATDPPIANEFDADNSNLRGTLSTALLSGQPDSGTSGWFINVVDNTHLDAAQHTVFGRVIGDGMDIVDVINAIPIYNLNPFESPTTGAFASLPLVNYTELSQPLTGTVSVSAGSVTVTGTGTSFTSELTVGDKVRIGNEDRFVSEIVSDTELRLQTEHVAGATDETAFINPDPTEENLVLFTGISEILSDQF